MFLRVGETTDVVTKEMYDFTDKDGSRIALRPEMTAGVVRAFVQHKPSLPWKVWYAGANFRHERPQKGRYRAFDQVGVEVLGVDDADLDVEVIALAWDFYRRARAAPGHAAAQHPGRARRPGRYAEAVRGPLPRAPAATSSGGPLETLERNPLRVLDSKRRADRAADRRRPGHRRPPVRRGGRALRTGPGRPGRPRHPVRRSSPGWSGASTTTAGPPSSSRPRPSTRRRTPSAAAAATTAWPRTWAARRRPASASRSGVDRILLACDAEGVVRRAGARPRRVRGGPGRRRGGPGPDPRLRAAGISRRPALRRCGP